MGVTKIEWCDYTWNPWRGCTKIAEGCQHCYAEQLAKRNPAVLGQWGPNGKRAIASESYWKVPFRWNDEALMNGTRPRVFCGSLMDFFEFRPDLDEHRVRALRTIYECLHLEWLVLTKRPHRALRLFRGPSGAHLSYFANNFDHMMLIFSASNQEDLDDGLPWLKEILPFRRGLSLEPLLGPMAVNLQGIDWVIVGGESGPNARSCHPEWVRSIRDQCQADRVPFFFKQWGEWLPASQYYGRLDEADGAAEIWAQAPEIKIADCMWRRVGKKRAGRLLDGVEWSEFPGLRTA